MSHKHRRYLAAATLSATLFAGGLATVGYAGYRMWSGNRVDGSSYLPAINYSLLGYVEKLAPDNSIPAEGAYLGTISIPSLDKTINIYQGTTDATLAKGVGHYKQSVMPGAIDNTVLAGHRDTVFSHLGRVKIGEKITIITKDGSFVYQVVEKRIVSSNDRTVIVPTRMATLTISTCYPFIFFGNAPKRYIVTADLIAQM